MNTNMGSSKKDLGNIDRINLDTLENGEHVVIDTVYNEEYVIKSTEPTSVTIVPVDKDDEGEITLSIFGRHGLRTGRFLVAPKAKTIN